MIALPEEVFLVFGGGAGLQLKLVGFCLLLEWLDMLVAPSVD
jgi:hypothetical protein